MSQTQSERIEFWSAVGLSAWVAFLHFLWITHAGPLWRDEVNTIEFASMPSVVSIWQNLRYDNFPPLFVLVARFWSLIGFSSDISFRILGGIIGLGVLASIWGAARMLGRRAPVLAIVLYAISPLAVSVGSSMRPYGLGYIFILLTIGLLWRFVTRPSRSAFIWTSLAAVASVQCLYHNALLVGTSILAACVACALKKDWRTAGGTVLVGVIAALSLLPHLGNISKAQDWFIISRVPVTWDLMWKPLKGALGAVPVSGPLDSAGSLTTRCVWLILFFLASAFALRKGLKKRDRKLAYCGTLLVASTVVYFIFLRRIGLHPQSWYFLLLLAPAAVCIDAIAGTIASPRIVAGRTALALAAALVALPNCYSGAQLRYSNMDHLAATLKRQSGPHDLIIASPWYYGVSFRRYYGTNGFTTLPPLRELCIHRYDLMKEAMQSDNPVGGLLQDVASTLRSGNTVWIIGETHYLQGDQKPQLFPPYWVGIGINDAAYFLSWSQQLAFVVQHWATNGTVVPIDCGGAVNPVENPQVTAFRGWRGN